MEDATRQESRVADSTGEFVSSSRLVFHICKQAITGLKVSNGKYRRTSLCSSHRPNRTPKLRLSRPFLPLMTSICSDQGASRPPAAATTPTKTDMNDVCLCYRLC
jgi:hypothetical protein